MRRPERASPGGGTGPERSSKTGTCRSSLQELTTGDAHAPRQTAAGRLQRSELWRVFATFLVTALVVGVTVALAADVGGSRASQATPRVALTDGSFAIANSRSGEAILTADEVAPGSPVGGQTTIANSGEIAGPITLSKSDVLDQPGPDGGRLTDIAELTVTDVTHPDAPTPVYAGRLAAMPEVPLGTFAPGEARIYGFTVSLPANAPGSGDVNAYQSSSLRVGYTWTGTAAPPPDVPPPPSPDTPPTTGAPSSPARSPSSPARSPSPPAGSPSPSADGSTGGPPQPSRDGDRSPANSNSPSRPQGGSPRPAPQAPPATSPPSTGASGAPAQPAQSDPGQLSTSGGRERGDGRDRRGRKRGKGGGRDRGLGGSPKRGPSTPDARARKDRSGTPSLLDSAKRMAAGAAEKGAFPLLLLLLLAGFSYVQQGLDRRDPKLALAPVDPEPTRMFD